MTETHRLAEELRRLEAIISGTDFEGERVAARVAMQKLPDKLRQIEVADPPVEYRFSMRKFQYPLRMVYRQPRWTTSVWISFLTSTKSRSRSGSREQL